MGEPADCAYSGHCNIQPEADTPPDADLPKPAVNEAARSPLAADAADLQALFEEDTPLVRSSSAQPTQQTPDKPAHEAPASFHGNDNTAPPLAPHSQAKPHPQTSHTLPFSEGWIVGRIYRVESPLKAENPELGALYSGRNTTSGAEVVIRRLDHISIDSARERAALREWLDRKALHCVPRILWTHQEDDCLVEVTEKPRGQTLAEWAQGKELKRVHVESLVDGIGNQLRLMHQDKARGVIYLGLTPRSIRVHTQDGIDHFFCAGWEMTRMLSGGRSWQVPPWMLPYQPPEAMGMDEVKIDDLACAWDWWALGRCVQELLLGRHVFKLLPNPRVAQEAMNERHGDLKPGLVEAMEQHLGEKLDPELRLLCQGLLSANPRARWNWASVEKWINHQATEVHYAMGTREIPFFLKGQPRTPAQAADYILTKESIAQNLDHGLSRSSEGTLAHFVVQLQDKRLKTHLEVGERLAEVPWGSLRSPLAMDWHSRLGASLVLSKIAGRSGTLAFATTAVNRAWVLSLVEEQVHSDDLLATLPAFIHLARAEVLQVLRTSGFADTAAQFEGMSQLLKGLQSLGKAHPSLLEFGDPSVVQAAFREAAKDPAKLLADAIAVAKEYPTSNHLAVAVQLGRVHEDPVAAAFICLAAASPERFQLLTKKQRADRVVADLRAKAMNDYNAALFLSLLRPLRTARWTYGGIPAWLFLNIPVALMYASAQGDLSDYRPYLAATLVMLILKFAGLCLAKLWLKRARPVETPLPFRKAAAFCRQRAQLETKDQKTPELRPLLAQLEKTNALILKASLPDDPPMTLEVPTLAPVWLLGLAHFVLLAGAARMAWMEAAPYSPLGKLRTGLTGQQPHELASVARATSLANLNLFGPSKEQLSQAAQKLFAGLPPPPAGYTRTAATETPTPVAGEHNVWTMQTTLYLQEDLFEAQEIRQLPELSQLNTAQQATNEFGQAVGTMPALPSLPQVLVKVASLGQSVEERLRFSGQEDPSSGWSFTMLPLKEGASTLIRGNLRSSFPASIPRADDPAVVESLQTLRASYAKIIDKAAVIREERAMQARFAPVMPGVSYTGVVRYLDSDKGSWEATLVMDACKLQGERLAAFLIMVDRPWVRKLGVGRVVSGSGGNMQIKLKFEESWGSSSLDSGIWSPNRASEFTLSISPESGFRGEGHDFKGNKLEFLSEHLKTPFEADPGCPSKLVLSPELEELKAKAIAGDASAALALGRAYNIAQPHEFAFWADRAAALGEKDGRRIIAILMLEGLLKVRNTTEALGLLENLANERHGRSLAVLGQIYANGKYGLSKDEGRAARYFERSAQTGDIVGMYEHGINLIMESNERRRIEGADLLRQAADKGYAPAASMMASCLDRGIGVERNKSEASRYKLLAQTLYAKQSGSTQQPGPALPGGHTLPPPKKNGTARDKLIDLFMTRVSISGYLKSLLFKEEFVLDSIYVSQDGSFTALMNWPKQGAINRVRGRIADDVVTFAEYESATNARMPLPHTYSLPINAVEGELRGVHRIEQTGTSGKAVLILDE